MGIFQNRMTFLRKMKSALLRFKMGFLGHTRFEESENNHFILHACIQDFFGLFKPLLFYR